MIATTTLSIPQLIMLRSLKTAGWSADALVLPYLWQRAGATEAEWTALADAGLVELQTGRWALTPAGKRALKKQSTGKWF